MSVNTKMTALADEIRELSGTTTTKSIDVMTTDVNVANTEITEQADLIAQISAALEGKTAVGGSGDSSITTAEVTVEAINSTQFIYISASGTKESISNISTTVTMSVPSLCYAFCGNGFTSVETSGNANLERRIGAITIFYVTGNSTVIAIGIDTSNND